MVFAEDVYYDQLSNFILVFGISESEIEDMGFIIRNDKVYIPKNTRFNYIDRGILEFFGEDWDFAGSPVLVDMTQ